MRFIYLLLLVFIFIGPSKSFSQDKPSPRLFAHKVVVHEIIQTKNYTYLYVREQIKEKDSLIWLAVPSFKPAIGDVYYFDSGLQMGEFKSKELDRTFNDILFLGGLSSTPDITGKNVIVPPADTIADTTGINSAPPVLHTVIVKEVLQTSGYTYLRVQDGDLEEWLASIKVSASPGQTYTFDDAGPMSNFESKELKRTFKEILFVANLKLVTDSGKNNSTENKTVKNKPVKGCISIHDLLSKKEKYEGKLVKIKGQVTKYSSGILNKNWVHIEDGTSFSGKIDLTLTTDQEVKMDDNIIVEGKIVLNKDFGSGYFFEVIMEDAKLLTE